MKKALYTINFGKYDSLKEPEIITPGWDYICFTNNKDLTSDNWTIQYIELDLPNNLAARFCYTQPNALLKSYDLTIMIGGQIKCEGNLDEFLAKYIDLDYDYNLMNHCRNCTYKEALENEKFFGDKRKLKVAHQMDNYLKDGFPVEFGLYAHGVIVCKNNFATQKHQAMWWDEISNDNYVVRDQLSFMYVCWKYGFIKHRGFADYWDFMHSGYFSIWSHGIENIKRLRKFQCLEVRDS